METFYSSFFSGGAGSKQELKTKSDEKQQIA